jgi:hypothetical protein
MASTIASALSTAEPGILMSRNKIRIGASNIARNSCCGMVGKTPPYIGRIVPIVQKRLLKTSPA